MEKDSENQSAERFKRLTLPALHWQLAVHAGLLDRSPHAGR
jgi:hypothetical protein